MDEVTAAPSLWSLMSAEGQQAFFNLASLCFHHLGDEFRRWPEGWRWRQFLHQANQSWAVLCSGLERCLLPADTVNMLPHKRRAD